MVSEHSQQFGSREILVAGLDLQLRPARVNDAKPTGMQIAEAAGFAPTPEVTVLQWLEHGLEDIRPTETVSLQDDQRFIVAKSDGSWRMFIDGIRYDWPASSISVSVVRILAAVPANKGVFLIDPDNGEVLLSENRVLNLSQAGGENLVTRSPSWKLNVQGVILTIDTPKISVHRALELAGVDADQGWHIYLIVRGQGKQEVHLDEEIDLTMPGIEKLRLTPKDVSNGEAITTDSKQFVLLPADENYLNEAYPSWLAIIENGRRWIVLPDFKIPSGFSVSTVSLALEIPPTYPMAQIDMFYLYPEVALSSGIPIPATEHREKIQNNLYQRWSRHRNGRSIWRPGIDNVLTHLALVESALLKECAQ